MAAYADQILAMQKERMPVLPQQVAEMFANIKFDAKTEKTGKTATVQGVREENLLTVSLEIPNPAGPPMQMRMEIHQWLASPEEVTRIPALQELAVYAALRKTGMDPMDTMTKAMTAFPGLADKMHDALQEITKNQGKPMLRMQSAVYMPSMANLVAGGGGSAGTTNTRWNWRRFRALHCRSRVQRYYRSPNRHHGGSDGNVVPSGQTSGAGGGSAEGADTAAPSPAGGIPRGTGVTAPAVLQRIEPTSTEEARAARISGSVLLFVVVGEDGKARQMRVLRSLDPGLD